jgi:hypothetical protein
MRRAVIGAGKKLKNFFKKITSIGKYKGQGKK